MTSVLDQVACQTEVTGLTRRTHDSNRLDTACISENIIATTTSVSQHNYFHLHLKLTSCIHLQWRCEF